MSATRTWLLTPATAIWLVLCLATGLAWWLGGGHGSELLGRAGTAALLLLIAFFKIRLVIMHFMEVRGAPRALRLACDAWVVGVPIVILGLYLLR